MKKLALALTSGAMMLSSPLYANCDLSNYAGWQIIYTGKVTGYIDDDGSKEDDFEGCDYDRVLLIDYDKAVTCTGYGYSYSYNPDIAILKNTYGTNYPVTLVKACIDDDWYDISLDVN